MQVCGAKSCPPINVYASDTIDDNLTVATTSFFSDPSSFTVSLATDKSSATVTLSRLLSWYGSLLAPLVPCTPCDAQVSTTTTDS